jgi:hypothetical protein
MLNKTFCYIAGTGRTGTHWAQRLIQASCDKKKVATFHDGFPKRAKPAGRKTPVEFFQNYLLNLMLANQGAQSYVECNPALLEHVGLHYGIRNAVSVIPGGMMALETRGVLMVRHPFGYVASMKARGYGWGWWRYPQARQVYGIGEGYTNRPCIERYAVAWKLKNEFFFSLTQMDVPILKFESILAPVAFKEQFIAEIDALFDGLGLEPIQGAAFWWKLRGQRAAGKAKGSVTLTAPEKQTVKRICGPMMEVLEYE